MILPVSGEIHSFIYLHQTNGPYQEKQQQQKKEKDRSRSMHTNNNA